MLKIRNDQEKEGIPMEIRGQKKDQSYIEFLFEANSQTYKTTKYLIGRKENNHAKLKMNTTINKYVHTKHKFLK
jgi:hypothetical protein